ncbi:MAG: hypothetical protein RLZZ623_2091, partial [Actinomycetota bacterium]
ASTVGGTKEPSTNTPMVRVAEKVRASNDGVLASLARDDDPLDS